VLVTKVKPACHIALGSGGGAASCAWLACSIYKGGVVKLGFACSPQAIRGALKHKSAPQMAGPIVCAGGRRKKAKLYKGEEVT